MQGNVILTDKRYEILTLLRSHRDDAQGVAFMARHPYPLQYVRLRQAVTSEALQGSIDQADGKATLRSKLSHLKAHPHVSDSLQGPFEYSVPGFRY